MRFLLILAIVCHVAIFEFANASPYASPNDLENVSPLSNDVDGISLGTDGKKIPTDAADSDAKSSEYSIEDASEDATENAISPRLRPHIDYKKKRPTRNPEIEDASPSRNAGRIPPTTTTTTRKPWKLFG